MTADEIRLAVSAILEREGVTYTAEFVPQKHSRNATKKGACLNWRIILTRKDREPMSTDYMQGIGRIPAIVGKSYPLELRAREYEAAQTGRYQVRANSSFLSKALPIPSAADVLSCLVLDAGALDAGCFEMWADDYGYDKDSRAGEAIYRACIDSGLKLRALLGVAVVNELREATVDL